MKALLLAASCAALVACGSSGDSAKSMKALPTAAEIGTAEPDTQLIQMVGPEQLNWESGEIELKYALQVTNHAADPITLRQIQIQSVGVEGPYSIPASSYFFRKAVAAGDTTAIEFYAKALSEGNRYRIDAESPVAIRIIAFFEAPKGNFRKAFITNLGQSFQNDH
jgi:hypothetical protein